MAAVPRSDLGGREAPPRDVLLIFLPLRACRSSEWGDGEDRLDCYRRAEKRCVDDPSSGGGTTLVD
jgi:hypothetical protein